MADQGLPPHITAHADQDYAADSDSLATHVVACAELVHTQGLDPIAAYASFSVMLRDDPRTAARLAAAAIVRLALTASEDDLS